jgi:hypothetical protein
MIIKAEFPNGMIVEIEGKEEDKQKIADFSIGFCWDKEPTFDMFLNCLKAMEKAYDVKWQCIKRGD